MFKNSLKAVKIYFVVAYTDMNMFWEAVKVYFVFAYRRHKSVSKAIIFAIAVNMLRIYHAYAE